MTRHPLLRRRQRERGAISVAGTGFLILLITLAFAVAIPSMQALAVQQKSRSAADAAALAGAEAWAGLIEEQMRDALLTGVDPTAIMAALAGYPGGPQAPLVIRADAEKLARANEAGVAGLRIDTKRLEVTVRVRSEQSVRSDGLQFSYEEATAKVKLDSGLCLTKGSLGISVRRDCLRELPTDPAEFTEMSKLFKPVRLSSRLVE